MSETKKSGDDTIWRRLVAPESGSAVSGAADDAGADRFLHEARRTWEALDLPPAEGAPVGFATRVVALARAESGRSLRTPAVRRLSAVAALAGGIAIGATLAWAGTAEEQSVAGITLAESYLEAAAGSGDSAVELPETEVDESAPSAEAR